MGYKKGDALKTAFDIYTIQRQRGVGGSGEVYEVNDSEGTAYAAKILDAAKASAKRLKRFKNEIHFCTRYTHPNIVQVQASGITDDGATFYVMPLYSGTLRDLIEEGIPPNAVVSYFNQVLDGVGAAHLQGVWHRDIKPENILFSREADILVVADFGIAHFEEEDLLTAVETKNDERLANFLYSAPEQRIRGQCVNGKSDVYALGLILNEMFTKSVPQGTGFRRVSDATNGYAYLDGLIDLMLRHDPAPRPDLADVKRELIARGNEFVSLQRLNSLKTEVIPETEVDDPVVSNPISLVGVNYQEGELVFELSTVPPPNWIMAFQNPRASGWSSLQGSGPEYFSFRGNEARVGLRQEMLAQRLVDYTKTYIDLANQQYATMVTENHRKRLAREREELRKRVEEEERRQKILSGIKI
jgi:serine/threonine protein kinase